MRRPGVFDPLRERVFRRLVSTYAINDFGDWMGIVALSILVFERTESPLATAGLFLGTRVIPALLGPLLVTRVERVPPRFALPVIYCGEAVVFAGLAFLAGHFSLAAVIALATVDGALALTGRSLTRAVVAAHLGPGGALRAGNALLNIAFTTSSAIGPGVAGLIAGAFGVQAALLLDAASFYAIAVILFTAGPLPQAEPEAGDTRERVRAGVAYLRDNLVLRRLLLAQGAAFVFFTAVIPIEVIYAKETLGTGDAGYGLMLTSWGVGMLLGSLLFARARRAPLIMLLALSTVAVGVGYLGLAAAPSLAIACVASVVGGTGNGVQWVSAISAVQELTESGMQARVMAVLESIGAAMPGVGFAVGGLIAAIATPRATFLVAGLGVLAIVALIAPTLRGKRAGRLASAQGFPLDESNHVVLELLPGGMPTSNAEVEP
jgi:MFS family permease